jgi:hypothetical protein
LDRFAREPSSDVGIRPDHPAETARKKNEASKAAPKAPPKEPDAKDGKNIPPVDDDETVVDSKGENTSKMGEQPKPGEPQKPKKPSDFLREELAKQKARAEAYEKELTALKAPKEDPEKIQLTERVTAAEKRAQEREDELRHVNYERSEEYQTKYFKPYVEAFNVARNKITSLDVVERKQVDPATGEERIVQKGRQAVPEDFDQIALMPSDREARLLAKQLFGEDYAVAIQHREKVHELNLARNTALNEQRTKGAEREKLQTEQRTKAQAESQKRNAEMWTSANKEFAEKHPDWFADVEGDEEGNAMLKKDISTTDALFGDVSQLPPEKVVKLHSEMRNRAAAAGRLAHLLTKTKAELAEAKKKLQGYEGSEPKDGNGVSEKPSGDAAPDTIAGVMNSLDKYGRERTNFY